MFTIAYSRRTTANAWQGWVGEDKRRLICSVDDASRREGLDVCGEAVS